MGGSWLEYRPLKWTRVCPEKSLSLELTEAEDSKGVGVKDGIGIPVVHIYMKVKSLWMRVHRDIPRKVEGGWKGIEEEEVDWDVSWNYFLV